MNIFRIQENTVVNVAYIIIMRLSLEEEGKDPTTNPQVDIGLAAHSVSNLCRGSVLLLPITLERW